MRLALSLIAACLLLAACAAPTSGTRKAPVQEATGSREAGQATAKVSPERSPAATARPDAPPPQASKQPETRQNDAPAVAPAWGQRYYLDDGPGDMPAAEMDRIPDAVPRDEAPHRFANRPYSVFGVTYEPAHPPDTFSQRGMASWYGRRFHGKPTSSGEPYDMYKMSAAHPTLPIPSYARVTNLANGRSVVVRVNDRGPFHPGRIMDLSYAAAHRLGYASKGSAEVLVEAIKPGEQTDEAATTAGSQGQAAAAVAEATAAPRRPPGGAREGLWLQLGAFRERANAERMRDSLAGRVGELSGRLEVFEHRGAWRVGFGPVRDEAGAASLRARLLDLTGVRAITLKP